LGFLAEDGIGRLFDALQIEGAVEATLRRRWRLEDVAERMGVSRFTVADVERGKPGTSMAAYLGALWVLGLLDQLQVVADPDRDEEGKALEAARQPGQAPRRHRFDDDF
jgi:transcriptional regulator with XRE-family HTH domain